MEAPNTREGIEELKNEFIQEYKAGHKDGGMRSYLFTGQNGSLIADWWIKKINLIEQTLHQELQKAREQRKGWKGYLVVDPETDNYTYSDVYLNRIDAEKWLKANGISGLKIIEVDVYQSDLDQPNK